MSRSGTGGGRGFAARFARMAAVPAALLLLTAGGLRWMGEVDAAGGQVPAAADGIVVLTGGAERIGTALRLLSERHGAILLVSGVGGSADLDALARRSGAAAALRDRSLGARVTLGRSAASTYGNALETAEWARLHALRSLIVVTASYHMPRAIIELSRAIPGITLYPVAVQPRAPDGLAQWRLLVDEYAKWLIAKVGLSGYVGQHAAQGLLNLDPLQRPA